MHEGVEGTVPAGAPQPLALPLNLSQLPSHERERQGDGAGAGAGRPARAAGPASPRAVVPSSQVVRYRVPGRTFAEWTKSALATLGPAPADVVLT